MNLDVSFFPLLTVLSDTLSRQNTVTCQVKI